MHCMCLFACWWLHSVPDMSVCLSVPGIVACHFHAGWYRRRPTQAIYMYASILARAGDMRYSNDRIGDICRSRHGSYLVIPNYVYLRRSVEYGKCGVLQLGSILWLTCRAISAPAELLVVLLRIITYIFRFIPMHVWFVVYIKERSHYSHLTSCHLIWTEWTAHAALGWDGMGCAGNSMYFNGGFLR